MNVDRARLGAAAVRSLLGKEYRPREEGTEPEEPGRQEEKEEHAPYQPPGTAGTSAVPPPLHASVLLPTQHAGHAAVDPGAKPGSKSSRLGEKSRAESLGAVKAEEDQRSCPGWGTPWLDRAGTGTAHRCLDEAQPGARGWPSPKPPPAAPLRRWASICSPCPFPFSTICGLLLKPTPMSCQREWFLVPRRRGQHRGVQGAVAEAG